MQRIPLTNELVTQLLARITELEHELAHTYQDLDELTRPAKPEPVLVPKLEKLIPKAEKPQLTLVPEPEPRRWPYTLFTREAELEALGFLLQAGQLEKTPDAILEDLMQLISVTKNPGICSPLLIACAELYMSPLPSQNRHVKKLVQHNLGSKYSLKIGQYRVLFSLDEHNLPVLNSIAHRDAVFGRGFKH